MRVRELFAGALLTLLAGIQTNAGALIDTDYVNESCPNPEEAIGRAPERQPAVSIPEPSAVVKKDLVLSTAYFDTMKILGSTNECSAFFGGSEGAVGVFSSFMGGVRKDFLPASVGLKMSGQYMNVINAQTKARFRLFERTSVNSGGPFYRQKASTSGAMISSIGSFPPNSREARVLMLLHELGHLMRGNDGQWLLPDDGNSISDSFRNTRKIESVCGDQIRGLNQGVKLDLVRQGNTEQTVSPAAATSSHH